MKVLIIYFICIVSLFPSSFLFAAELKVSDITVESGDQDFSVPIELIIEKGVKASDLNFVLQYLPGFTLRYVIAGEVVTLSAKELSFKDYHNLAKVAVVITGLNQNIFSSGQLLKLGFQFDSTNYQGQSALLRFREAHLSSLEARSLPVVLLSGQVFFQEDSDKPEETETPEEESKEEPIDQEPVNYNETNSEDHHFSDDLDNEESEGVSDVTENQIPAKTTEKEKTPQLSSCGGCESSPSRNSPDHFSLTLILMLILSSGIFRSILKIWR